MQLFKHQQKLLDETKDLSYFAILWEMRVGKTLASLYTFVHNFEIGKIDAVFLIAPSGVDLKWTREDLAKARPHDNVLEFRSSDFNKVSFQKKFKSALADRSKLLWVVTNAEGLITDSCRAMVAKLLENRNCGLLVDESDLFKNPRARRTKCLMKLSTKFLVKRILTGTVATKGPFDLWSQFYILSPEILGPTFVPFKQRYGIFRTVRYGGPSFQELVAYRDLDHLQARIAKHSSRITQADVFDMPEMVHDIRLFEMSVDQKKHYDSMVQELIVRLDGGEEISVTAAIVALLRLQQISRGFIGDGEEVHKIPGSNPCLDSLVQLVSQLQSKFIIWCRQIPDIENIMQRFGEEKINVVRYDGSVSTEDRYSNLQKFKTDESILGIVGTPSTGGIGIDLSIADTTIFYSQSYDLRERLQAIARMQGPNQKSKVLLLVDMVGVGTKDKAILKKLDQKFDMLSQLTGDSLRALLEGDLA